VSVSITHESILPHPPERIWTVLTDRAAIERWLMPNDFEPRLGHRFTFRTQPNPAANFDGIVHCEVVEIEPPRRLAYSWVGGGLTTKVTYRLEREGDGTRLCFEQSGFDLDDPAQKYAYNGARAGWPYLLERLRAAVDELVGAGR
jgi:uncharacterized protein YndB with AHSA1/START domain